jgi:hypothetical protein
VGVVPGWAVTVPVMRSTLLLVPLLAVITVALSGDTAELVTSANTVAGRTSISSVIANARVSGLATGTEWGAQLGMTAADLVDGTIDVNGTTVRWRGVDSCLQADVPDRWSPVDITDCPEEDIQP